MSRRQGLPGRYCYWLRPAYCPLTLFPLQSVIAKLAAMRSVAISIEKLATMKGVLKFLIKKWAIHFIYLSFGFRQNKIGATRKTGGSSRGYKPPLLTRASRRGLLLCSSLSVIVTLAAPKGTYLANGSSYSFTLNLSFAISCFS